jgi:hypothetical protein
MEIVAQNDKTILVPANVGPLTIERVDGRVVLQQYKKALRLGPQSAQWLLDTLSISGGHYLPQRALFHQGRQVLTVVQNVNYTYIEGTTVRFVLNQDVIRAIREWLYEHLP